MVKFVLGSIAVMVITFASFAEGTSDTGKIMHKSAIIAGACLFSTSYLTCVVLSFQNSPNNSYLSIPICGPFLTSKYSGDRPFSSPGFYIACVLSAVQGIGLTCFTIGLPRERKRHPVELVPIINKTETGFILKVHV